jgi:hypothetical protein
MVKIGLAYQFSIKHGPPSVIVLVHFALFRANQMLGSSPESDHFFESSIDNLARAPRCGDELHVVALSIYDAAA